ncbi:MAG: cobalamin biosynthesis protein [Alphaproteobacteria bacterium]|nr:cobalamin biosynthesis protein [Alphaproteobacteria bacterium]
MSLEIIQSHLLVVVIGYLISLCFGSSLRHSIGLPLRRFVHSRIRTLGERLNKRSIATRVWRGLILLVLLMVPCLALDWFLGSAGLFAGIIIALSADLQPSLWHGWVAVSAGKVRDERRLASATSALALEPQSAPDHHGTLRLIILGLIHHFTIVLVGGAFWFALLGLKGMLCYYMLAVASHYFRDSEQDWKAFGWAAGRCFTLVDAVPSLLSIALLFLASIFVPKAKPFAALSAYARATDEHHAYAVAAALKIGLGGPRVVNGKIHQTPWIGDGTARLEATDLARFMTLFTIALFEFAVLLLFIINL